MGSRHPHEATCATGIAIGASVYPQNAQYYSLAAGVGRPVGAPSCEEPIAFLSLSYPCRHTLELPMLRLSLRISYCNSGTTYSLLCTQIYATVENWR